MKFGLKRIPSCDGRPSRHSWRGLAVLAAALSLASCVSGSREIGTAPDITVLDTNSLPSPFGAGASGSSALTHLGRSDLLKITVAGVEWLSDQEIRVDLNGEISFPLAGPVEAAGLTPRELEAVLVDRLISNGKMVAPKVSVNVMEVLSQTVTVEGQVRLPGIYPMTQSLTLLQAVALAQGTEEFSKLDDVVVFRTVENRRYAALYDLDAIRHGTYSDPEIFADDIVMVGDARGRRMFQDILAIVPLITSPLVVALR